MKTFATQNESEKCSSLHSSGDDALPVSISARESSVLSSSGSFSGVGSSGAIGDFHGGFVIRNLHHSGRISGSGIVDPKNCMFVGIRAHLGESRGCLPDEFDGDLTQSNRECVSPQTRKESQVDTNRSGFDPCGGYTSPLELPVGAVPSHLDTQSFTRCHEAASSTQESFETLSARPTEIVILSEGVHGMENSTVQSNDEDHKDASTEQGLASESADISEIRGVNPSSEIPTTLSKTNSKNCEPTASNYVGDPITDFNSDGGIEDNDGMKQSVDSVDRKTEKAGPDDGDTVSDGTQRRLSFLESHALEMTLLDGSFQSSTKECCTSKSLLEVVSGVTWGWGFTSTPKEKWLYYAKELLNGLVICFAQVPESVAFSFMANVDPAVGLHAAWIMGFIASVFGGRPGMINGATGAFAAVIGSFVERKCSAAGVCTYEGVEILFLSVMIAGVLIILFSFLRLGVLVQLISTPVMIGFCNGLAIVIGLAQLHPFKTSFEDNAEWVTGMEALYMSIICVVAAIVMEFWGRIPYVGRVIPSALVALGSSILIEFVIIRQFDAVHKTKTVGDIAPFSRETAFPNFFFIDSRYDMAKLERMLSTWDGQQKMWLQAFILAVVGLCEELMTVEVVNELLHNNGNTDQQCFAMGVGNVVCGFCGTMGGNSMIGLSAMNCRSGSKGKESGVSAAVGVFAMMAGLNMVLNYVPMAGLSGIMFVVVIHTFKWFSIPMIVASFMPMRLRRKHWWLLQKIKRWDAFIIILVTVLCPVFNLAVAIGVGAALSAMVFAWSSMKHCRIRRVTDSLNNIRYFEIEGPLFYASKTKVVRSIAPDKDGKDVVVVLSGHTRLYDYSALQALNHLSKKHTEAEQNFRVVGLTDDCRRMQFKAGHLMEQLDTEVADIQLPLFVRSLYETKKSS